VPILVVVIVAYVVEVVYVLVVLVTVDVLVAVTVALAVVASGRYRILSPFPVVDRSSQSPMKNQLFLLQR